MIEQSLDQTARPTARRSVDKRYQVFISSTFKDLKEERQAVLRAILELDHMPAGMELFPAADDDAWRLIQDVIDASDYYVLIVGGRYGSLDETGISYTQKEYEYALETKKPVVALLHKNPEILPRENTETDEQAWGKLKEFRANVEKRHTCVYWESAEDLKAKVIVGITTSVKRRPGVGWIRADKVPTGATITEVLSLRQQIAELESELETRRVRPREGTEDLAQGNDQFEIAVSFRATAKSGSSQHYTAKISPSWNDIFASVAPCMIDEVSDWDLRRAFKACFAAVVVETFSDEDKFKGKWLSDGECEDEVIDTCIVQLRALDLIQASQRKRSVKDTTTYWSLTPYGDYIMVKLRAIRRTADGRPESGEQGSPGAKD